MTAAVETGVARTPWHLWLVGAVAVLWNGFGSYDYTMTKLKGDAYMQAAGMTPDQIAHMHAMPGWMTGVWAVGVWGGLLGAVLLLARSRLAVYAFAASMAAVVVMLCYDYLLSDAAKVMGQQGALMNVIITGGALVFLGYAWAMAKRGVLR